MKAQVIKLLKEADIDISRLRIIQHGEYIDIYPKVPIYYNLKNTKKSNRRDPGRGIYIDNDGVKHIPVLTGYHSTKISKIYAQIDKLVLDNDMTDTIDIIKAYLESEAK